MAEIKLFLDTNVILDFLLERNGELNEIEQILTETGKGKIDGYISESVFSTSIYFLQKQKIKNIMPMMRSLCDILKILPLQHAVVNSSLEIFKDLEDGLVFFLAKHHKMDYFITRNLADFKYAPSTLPVLTPSQFIKLFE